MKSKDDFCKGLMGVMIIERDEIIHEYSGIEMVTEECLITGRNIIAEVKSE